MAKLSAHGYEIIRLKKIIPAKPDDNYWGEGEELFSFRSDGVILSCMKIAFGPGAQKWDQGKSHSWGWKIWRKFKPPRGKNFDSERAIKFAAKLVEKNGWENES